MSNDDYEDYLEWSKSYKVPDDGRATDFMIIMFWWVPWVPILVFIRWMGWIS